jgi:hypothetical protein
MLENNKSAEMDTLRNLTNFRVAIHRGAQK